MPLFPYTPECIVVAISDFVRGELRLKRKARYINLHHPQAADGSSSVSIEVEVTHYATSGADYGEEVTDPTWLLARTYTLRADNLTLVDMTTGALLAMREPGQTDADWQAVVDSFPQNTMLQADHFVFVRDHVPLLLRPMIEGHICAADGMGRFA